MTATIASSASHSARMRESWRDVTGQCGSAPCIYSRSKTGLQPAESLSTTVCRSRTQSRPTPGRHSSNIVLHGEPKSIYMISDDVYDSDDAANRSPGLKPSIVRYGPDESIPPFMAEKQREMSAQGKRDSSRSSSISSCDGNSSKRRRSRRVRASLADAVLMHNLAPDRPDIAREIGERTPPAESESEDEGRTFTAYIHIKPNSTRSGTGTDTSRILPADPRKTAPALPSVGELLSLNSSRPSIQDSLPYQSESRRRPRQDSLATSSVGKYTIPPPKEFPAMQAPTPSTANSPEDSQRLPSIMSALAKLDGEHEIGPFAAPTPSQLSTAPSNLSTMSMGSNLDSLFTPSQTLTPFTQGSPMNLQELSNTSPISYPVPHPSLTPDTSNMTAYSDTPAVGVASVRSPTKSYPTPQEPRPALLEGVSDGTLAANIHKCTYPGCTAPAFQTQYLLNSHANVHSSDRPHFCPVPDCPRGAGGKGFKRKNEMIRHGLVHNSPGYVCPFCTDQQHKYPRPDNLQRHVRVHHQDKKMDDPLLRDVLAQRPKGSGRGRRRRGHS